MLRERVTGPQAGAFSFFCTYITAIVGAALRSIVQLVLLLWKVPDA